MSVDELEQLAEQIKIDFLKRTMELSNSEIQVVIEYLQRYFDDSLELLQQGNR